MEKKTFSKNDVLIVEALKEAKDGLTLAEISSAAGVEIKSGHVVGAMKKGLIQVIGEREIQRPRKRKVGTYLLVNDEIFDKYKYTDNEIAIVKVAATMKEPFTLAELATAMGKERLTSGSINALVKKGNMVRCEDDRVIDAFVTLSVNVYGYVSNIPADAEIR